MAIKTLNFFVEMQNVNLGYGRTTYRVFTSDEHSIELNFDIQDIEDLSGMTAEVMIYTEDKSLFVNKATFKAPNSYSYIMQPQEDARRGLCIVQLLLKDGSKILTSPKFRFEIERSVNDEVVQESGIVNTWEDFRKDTETWSKEYQEKLDAWSQEMTEKVNEMKSKAEKEEARRVEAEELRVRRENVRAGNEASREQTEKSRNTAETNRAEAEKLRVEAESKRNSRYEQAEADRNNKYSTAETERKEQFANAEQDRADAEAKRVSAEQSRASEESKRASAESERDAAEIKRANAESSRADAEKERASKFNGWDKTMQGVIPEATSTKAGIVKVEGKSGETAPYNVYSKGKIDELVNSKQDQLTAGENIKIVDNKISGTASYDDSALKKEIQSNSNTLGNHNERINKISQEVLRKQNKPTDGSRFLTDKDIAFHPSYSKPNAPVFLANELWLTPHPQFQPKQVWTEFNQGSGSGLDADLLDGKHADQFVLKSEQKNSPKILSGKAKTFHANVDSNRSFVNYQLIDHLLFIDAFVILNSGIKDGRGQTIFDLSLAKQIPSLANKEINLGVYMKLKFDSDGKAKLNSYEFQSSSNRYQAKEFFVL